MMVEMILLKTTKALPQVRDYNLSCTIDLSKILILILDCTVIFGKSGEAIRFPKVRVIVFNCKRLGCYFKRHIAAYSEY